MLLGAIERYAMYFVDFYRCLELKHFHMSFLKRRSARHLDICWKISFLLARWKAESGTAGLRETPRSLFPVPTISRRRKSAWNAQINGTRRLLQQTHLHHGHRSDIIRIKSLIKALIKYWSLLKEKKCNSPLLYKQSDGVSVCS